MYAVGLLSISGPCLQGPNTSRLSVSENAERVKVSDNKDCALLWHVGVWVHVRCGQTVSVYTPHTQTHTQKPTTLLPALGENQACHSQRGLPWTSSVTYYLRTLPTPAFKRRRPFLHGPPQCIGLNCFLRCNLMKAHSYFLLISVINREAGASSKV